MLDTCKHTHQSPSHDDSAVRLCFPDRHEIRLVQHLQLVHLLSQLEQLWPHPTYIWSGAECNPHQSSHY
eukprot:9492192-Prorocentrum_lima.AAC.1